MTTDNPAKLNEYFDELPFWQRIFIGFLGSFLIMVVGVSSIYSGYYLIANDPSSAIPYASVASGVATVLLVGITFWYAFETRRMVQISERRSQRNQLSKQKKEIEDRNVLRRALIQEIGKKDYLNQLAEDYSVGHSRLETLIPTTIYEANADKIGKLTIEEIDVVVEFYTRADQVENLMEVQRQEDTSFDQDFLTELFQVSQNLVNSIVWKLSFGYIDPFKRRYRTQSIRNSINELADNQRRAISKLEENIENPENVEIEQ